MACQPSGMNSWAQGMLPESMRAGREKDRGVLCVICWRMLCLKRERVFLLSGMSHSEGVQPANAVRLSEVDGLLLLVCRTQAPSLVVLILRM